MTIEAVKGIKTLAELATEYQVHPNQISGWKRQLHVNAPELFSSGKAPRAKTDEELTAPLIEEIGRLKMDIKWLKKTMSLPLSTRRSWVEPSQDFSIRRQCRLAGVPRSGIYHLLIPETEENLTSEAFTGVLVDNEIAISMDGLGRALDNVFIERLWWSVKYEDVYPKSYDDGHELHWGLGVYFDYYNNERNHSSLDKRTPAEVFNEGGIRN